MLHEIKRSQMAQMSSYNSFYRNSGYLSTNIPVLNQLPFSSLTASQKLDTNKKMTCLNNFEILLQQPLFQRTQELGHSSRDFPSGKNDNMELCLLSDETLSFNNEPSSPAKTPFFCKAEDTGDFNESKEFSSTTDTKNNQDQDTNESSPTSPSDIKQTKITKNILFYRNHFLITSNQNLPKLDLPDDEDLIPKIKQDYITNSDTMFNENQAKLRSQIKSLDLFGNYSGTKADKIFLLIFP